MSNGNFAREIELISDRDLARERSPIFIGTMMPSTIVRKEIIDNEIDVVGEHTQRAKRAHICIGPNRLKVMDDGDGISTDLKEGSEFTHLWLACCKMFSSSNYSGVADSVGANGVGMTMANYTSKKFTVLNFNGKNIKGYRLVDGFLAGTDECKNNVASHQNLFNAQDVSDANETGDFVANPIPYKQAKEQFKPMFDNGFLVDIIWSETPNSLFQDKVDINWIVDYTKCRVGEITSGEITMEVYEDDEFTTLSKQYIWSKNPSSENYIKSWAEQVKENGGKIIKDGPWSFAFFKDPVKIRSVVQGAPIRPRDYVKQSITIQDYNVTMNVAMTLKYVSTDYPAYTDQTKTDIRLPYTALGAAFQRSGEVYNHYYRLAEQAFMAKAIKDSDSSMFWPSLGNPEDSELIIAEGYSAISGLKSQRNPRTQACIALRGKISNCWNLDLQKAMRSEIVKQILNAVINTNYQRIIIASDEDTDGHHIAALLIALFARFTNLIQQGKVYRVHSPLFIFKAHRKPSLFSDKESDKPAGYTSHRNKGLGSLTADEVSRFIMDPNTRELIQIQWDDRAFESLDLAFTNGGEDWIINDMEE